MVVQYVFDEQRRDIRRIEGDTDVHGAGAEPLDRIGRVSFPDVKS